jgi:phosphoserine phosphatase
MVRTLLSLFLAIALVSSSTPHTRAQSDPLPSWNNGNTKRAIIAFVKRVIKPNSADFVPLAERIATFDNDGTLWVEKPMPNELYFALSRVKELTAKDASLRERQPYKAAFEGDASYFQQLSARDFFELFVASHSQMTQEQFASAARQFLKTEQHPRLNRPYTATTYRPMIELLAYLRANGFQIWICSGGTADFMRVFASQVYGVPPERTIGTVFKRDSRMLDGRRVIWELPELDSINDKEVKPVNIDRQIGIRPVFVGGNVGNSGDIAMMEYSKGRTGPSFQLLINHDDEVREFAYAEKDNFSLDAASKNGFTVVNMKTGLEDCLQRRWESCLGKVNRACGSRLRNCARPALAGTVQGVARRNAESHAVYLLRGILRLSQAPALAVLPSRTICPV